MDSLPVYVLATAPEDTRCALGAASRLASGLGAHIVILVAQVVDYTLPLEELTEDPAAVAGAYHALAADSGVDATVRVCVCRNPDDMYKAYLESPSIVVVGARKRRWWPTEAERTGRKLERWGHQVVFV